MTLQQEKDWRTCLMALEVDMTTTFYRKANLPIGLQYEPSFDLPDDVIRLRKSISEGTYRHSIIVFSGLKTGKTVSAAALLRSWISLKKNTVYDGVPGYFLPIHQLCYQNRTVDRFHKDTSLEEVIRIAATTDFLIMDGMFSYITQNDDLLLQSLYDARQHSKKTTVVTTNIENPMDCAGSILYRITRDAQYKVVF